MRRFPFPPSALVSSIIACAYRTEECDCMLRWPLTDQVVKRKPARPGRPCDHTTTPRGPCLALSCAYEEIRTHIPLWKCPFCLLHIWDELSLYTGLQLSSPVPPLLLHLFLKQGCDLLLFPKEVDLMVRTFLAIGALRRNG